MAIKIYTPEDAKREHEKFIPEFVFEAFNTLLAKKYNDKEVIITQKEALSTIMILSDIDDLSSDYIFQEGWLDIEDFYERNGWHVEYDKPSIGDNYIAYFKFIPKK